MNIKILTPEYVVFEGEVDSVLLPGKDGEFHIMKNHAGIVSSLVGGKVKLFTSSIGEAYAKNFTKESEKDSVFSYPIKSGVVEFNHDKGIILCE
ncbi:F0F1 ATP synthase subunit epsilon [Chryseobacterium carnipullorum]|uniref:F-ATPase epsilon subunit n=1 Tax=Chryseobacterium carnipullorum TaxID=1124835 RepID=A0A1M7I7C8_CHRCU|nr:F0F1 ATP synthase subunit epsilon [Chryseobacterium carnipullorum]AZA50069.1 F0F1 ATP synthase subunit epsilon [Chryseobacterium carnipullorum]AZA64947.1 F0F1 ATP synthase subunit epsilon [Chryseobacterium carnipullorum]SHM36644.1 F-type H+-transporting ATPase subunit epsilon [Chryseobacterium carnipullorum]STC96985.1 F-ATPase epsilon subunit [Chryseobacterium carnipullorum]HBV17752.1 F0F1 ATP synthase subunit epsilon [Chryseobacterium carnipullorum]